MLIEALITEDETWTLVDIPTLKIVTGCYGNEDVDEYIIDAVKLVVETEDVSIVYPPNGINDRVYVNVSDDIKAARVILKQHGMTEI